MNFGESGSAQRRNGYNKGIFEWLRKAPWGNPAFAGMFLSLMYLAVLGSMVHGMTVPGSIEAPNDLALENQR